MRNTGMTAYRRIYVPGGTYFFSVRLLGQRHGCLVTQIDALRSAYAACLARYPFETRAIVVLPDHMHCVWTMPQGDSDFSARWRMIKSTFSRNVTAVEGRSPSRTSKGERGIWQRRFWEHLVRDPADYEMHLNYCWHDPVRHGLVQDPCDWPHSSLHRDLRNGARLDPSFEPNPNTCFGE